jgi:hypothetical protein
MGGNMREGWKHSERLTGGYWHHATLPVFVVHYPKTQMTGEHYQGYKAIERVRTGAPVYSADNRRVGHANGFETLDQAMAACEAAVGGL